MPTDPDPIGADLRRARSERRIGTGKTCVLCGERDPQLLRMVRRSVVEEHHLAGKVNDAALTVPLCLNHHRTQSNAHLGAGVELGEDPQRTTVEKVISVLRGLAVFFQELAVALVAWADALAAHVARLDADSRAWRENELRGT